MKCYLSECWSVAFVFKQGISITTFITNQLSLFQPWSFASRREILFLNWQDHFGQSMTTILDASSVRGFIPLVHVIAVCRSPLTFKEDILLQNYVMLRMWCQHGINNCKERMSYKANETWIIKASKQEEGVGWVIMFFFFFKLWFLLSLLTSFTFF